MSEQDTRRQVRITNELLIAAIIAVSICFGILVSGISISETSRWRVIASVLATLMGIIFFAWSYNRYGSYYSPIGLMGGGWLGAIALSVLKLSPTYQVVWGVDLWIALFLSLGAFCIGCLLIDRAMGVQPLRIQATEGETKSRIRAIIICIFIIGYGAFAVQISRLHLSHGIDIYIKDATTAEHAFWMFGLGYLYLLNFVNVPFSVLYTLRYGRDRFILLILALSLISMPFHMIKTTIMMTIFATIICVELVRRGTITIARLAVTLLVMLSVFVGYVIFTGHTSSWFITTGQLRLPQEIWFLARPYLYTATNFDNLQMALNAGNRFSYGLRSLRPFYKLFLFYDLMDIGGQLKAQRPVVTDVFLTNSYLGMLYLDFGWAGIILGPIIYGGISQYVYKIARRTAQIPVIIMYGFIAYSVTFAFFWNYYASLFIWEIILICGVIYLVMDR